jgi:hypothetical protein
MWLITELQAELEFMKRIIKKVIKRKPKSLKKKGLSMTDAEYQAGMTAAIVAYQATITFPVQGFSYSYTPGSVTPPAETVQVTFPA